MGLVRRLHYNGRAGCGLNVESGAVNGDMAGSPHQVRQVNAYSNMVYDSHGNQTFADSASSDSQDRTIRYNAQDQAYEIFKGTAAAPSRMARFWYDPSGNRYKREDSGLGIVGTRRTLTIGNIEIVSENGTTTYKRYIGGALVQNVVNGIAANRYLFTDHLGSVIAATNETGAVLEGGGFNAFGERRTNGSATGITTTGLASTTRGFTGHEMLDDGLDVIHMNGRIYDPTLGRFLQADPVIQAPENPQSWNAYAYCFNNPYRYTDPTGMIGLEERQWLGAAVAIVATVLAPAAGLFVSSAAATSAATLAVVVAGGAIGGGIAGGSQGAIMGAFTSVLGLAGGGNALSSAFVGGVSSALQGGSFGSGFFSAGVVAMVAPGIGKIGSATGRVAVRALLGGTVSALTGGKFANGAAMAAFQGVLQEGGGGFRKSTSRGNRNTEDEIKAGRKVMQAAGDDANNAMEPIYKKMGYRDRDELARNLDRTLVPLTEKWHIEFGLEIFEQSGLYYPGTLVVGDDICASNNMCGVTIGFSDFEGAGDYRYAGDYHSHPSSTGKGFSYNDILSMYGHMGEDYVSYVSSAYYPLVALDLAKYSGWSEGRIYRIAKPRVVGEK